MEKREHRSVEEPRGPVVRAALLGDYKSGRKRAPKPAWVKKVLEAEKRAAPPSFFQRTVLTRSGRRGSGESVASPSCQQSFLRPGVVVDANVEGTSEDVTETEPRDSDFVPSGVAACGANLCGWRIPKEHASWIASNLATWVDSLFIDPPALNILANRCKPKPAYWALSKCHTPPQAI